MANKGVNFQVSATNRTGPAMRGVVGNLRNIKREMYSGQALQKSWNTGLNANRRMVQQFGFQLGDFATQIAGGQSAMLAFTQQGGQMLQFFGPFGAVSAAALAVFGSLAIAITRSGASLNQLAPALALTSDQIRMIADAWRWLGEAAIWTANLVINHLSAILGAAVVVGTYFAVKWVAAFISARAATLAFVIAMEAATAITTFTAMLSSAIVTIRVMAALFILATGRAVAYVASMFTAATATAAFSAASVIATVRSAALGVALMAQNAALLMQSVRVWLNVAAQSAWNVAMTAGTVALGGMVVGFRLLAGAIAATGIGALVIAAGLLFEAMMRVVKGAGNISNALVLVRNVASAVWGDMPTLALAAANMIEGYFTIALGAVVKAIAKVGKAMDELMNKLVPMKGVIDWATEGLFGDTIGGYVFGAIGNVGDDLLSAGGNAVTAGKMIASGAKQTVSAIDAIKEAWRKGGSDIDLGTMFGGGSPAAQADKQATQVETIFDNMRKSVAESIMSSFKSLLKGTMSVKDALLSILGSILDKIMEIISTPIFNSIAGALTSSILGGIGIDKNAEMPSFEGGGFTWSGPRSGGVDGRGGRLAVLHSDETVTDHRNGGSSGGTVVNMTINTPDAASFRASRRQIMQEVRSAAR